MAKFGTLGEPTTRRNVGNTSDGDILIVGRGGQRIVVGTVLFESAGGWGGINEDHDARPL